MDAEVLAKPKRWRFTAKYKIRIWAEADAATEPGAIGALLLRQCLYSSQLTTWRRECAAGIDLAFAKRRRSEVRRNAEAEEIAKLRRQN